MSYESTISCRKVSKLQRELPPAQTLPFSAVVYDDLLHYPIYIATVLAYFVRL